jgi:hypothetical protein
MSFNVNDLKKSKFLTQKDVTPPVVVTIDHEEEVNVAVEGAEKDFKWSLWFKELEKPLILNSTNGQIIAAITGSEYSNDWIGHKIVLYNDPNIFYGGKRTGGIRVRAVESETIQHPETKQSNPESVQERTDELMEYNALPKPNKAEQLVLKQICKEAFDDTKCEIKNRLAIWKYLNKNRWPGTADAKELIAGIKLLNEAAPDDEIPF